MADLRDIALSCYLDIRTDIDAEKATERQIETFRFLEKELPGHGINLDLEWERWQKGFWSHGTEVYLTLSTGKKIYGRIIGYRDEDLRPFIVQWNGGTRSYPHIDDLHEFIEEEVEDEELAV